MHRLRLVNIAYTKLPCFKTYSVLLSPPLATRPLFPYTPSHSPSYPFSSDTLHRDTTEPAGAPPDTEATSAPPPDTQPEGSDTLQKEEDAGLTFLDDKGASIFDASNSSALDNIAPGSLDEQEPAPPKRRKPVYKAKPREKPSILTKQDRAERDSKRIKEGRSLQLYNDKIREFFRLRDPYEAMVQFRALYEHGFPPDMETFELLIDGFVDMGDPAKAFQILAMMAPSGYPPLLDRHAAKIVSLARAQADKGGYAIVREMAALFRDYNGKGDKDTGKYPKHKRDELFRVQTVPVDKLYRMSRDIHGASD
jgi:hypothetical protein